MRVNFVLDYALDGWCLGRFVSVEGVQEYFSNFRIEFEVKLKESGLKRWRWFL